MIRTFVGGLLAFGCVCLAASANAQQDTLAAEADTVGTEEPIRMPEITVIGSAANALARIPGSAAVVGQAEMRQTIPLSGNEIFQRIPGVHVTEEEGVGLRANIGVRGLDPGRSRTVLMLEDGVPIALAPYGEPEMYYTPPIERMERVEVLKGSGSILFGPQTVGGVINYVTAPPPAEPGGSLELRGGSGGLFLADGRYGGTWQGVGATMGVLRKQASDLRGLFFDLTDVTGKVGFQAGSRSDIGVKLSVYDETSNSTYVGLTEAMYAANPNRPNLAQDDRLRVRRYAATATHDLDLGAGATLRTTLYGNNTSRDWQREDFEYMNGGDDIRFLNTTGNRNRAFDVAGIEPRLQWDHTMAGMPGELEAGLRFHYEQAHERRIEGSTGTSRTGEIRDEELRTGLAGSAYVQNRFHLSDRLRVTPGLRLESFAYDRNILRTRVRRENPATGEVMRTPEDVDIVTRDELFDVIPGIGMSFLPSERVTVFAGAHRGFAPPRIKDALIYPDDTLAMGEQVGEPVSLLLDAERSWNFEVGTRTEPAAGLQFEATAFLLDFSNQIIPSAQWAGSVADASLANQGQTRHVGFESGVTLDAGLLLGAPGGLRADASYTFARASFTGDRSAGESETVNGNRLPYAPENMVNVGLTGEPAEGVTVRLEGMYVDEQFADNFETATPAANGRIGLIPAYRTWNVSSTVAIPGTGLTAFGTVKNLLDNQYIVSRRPEGIKPGLPRQFMLGLRSGF